MKQKTAYKKKGALGMEVLPAVVISLGIAIFALALVLTLMGNLNTIHYTSPELGCTEANDTATNRWMNYGCGPAYNATVEGMEGLNEFNDWWPILVIAAIFLIIFGLLAVIRSRTARI